MTTSPTAPAPPSSSSRLLGAQGLRPVSPRLIPARYLGKLVGWIIELALATGLVVLGIEKGWWWPFLVSALLVVIVLQALVLTPRRVRALGYLDREEDLVVASGIMFRSISVTPYGRIQTVEIQEGPIERRFGLASISFSTASTDADGTIPGLPRAEAERLRELLTRRGIDRMQSL